MSQPRTSGRVYMLSNVPSLGSTPFLALLNSGGGVLLLREWRVYAESPSAFAVNFTPIYSIRMATGASPSGSLTAVELTSTGLATSAQGCTAFIGGPSFTTLLTLTLNYRKGIFWEAKRGKEFSIYAATSGWDVQQNGGGDNVYNHSFVYEE